MFCWSEEQRYHHCSGRTLPSSSHLTMGDRDSIMFEKGNVLLLLNASYILSLWITLESLLYSLLKTFRKKTGDVWVTCLSNALQPANLPLLCGFSCGWFQPTFRAWNVSNQPVRFSSNPCSVLYFARKSRSQSIEGSSATSQGPTTILFCGVVSGRCQGSCNCPRKRHGANMCQWTHTGHEFQQPSPILELHFTPNVDKCWSFSPQFLSISAQFLLWSLYSPDPHQPPTKHGWTLASAGSWWTNLVGWLWVFYV